VQARYTGKPTRIWSSPSARGERLWTCMLRAATWRSWPNSAVASRATGVPAPATMLCRNGPGPVVRVNRVATAPT
jgi:hypothetical protein